jgi:gamma-glutamyltranspeptidase/glutathione hydrolase
VLATEAAAVAFERGGNAIDAAIAGAVTLAVVYPHMCGVGGDLFALVQHPAGDVVAVNASGRAPAGADPDAASAAGGGSMPEHGPHTITVPGAVSGWEMLHRQGANLGWADAFAQAVAFAYGGISVARSLASSLEHHADRLGRDPGITGTFFAGGRPAGEHDLVRQPALGATLQAIADQGPSALYGGDVGERYAAGLADADVPIDVADLAGHTAELGSALRTRYRDVDVLTHPPNSQGFVLLELLAIVERLGIDPDPLGPDAPTLARIARAADRDRDLHLAADDRMRLHVSSLLDDGHLAALGDGVRGDVGFEGLPHAAAHPSGDTIALVTADAEGRGVSLIQSLFDGFGSGILEPSTGIVAQNRGACFTLDPEHANLLAPGARPAHTLMPVIVQRAGRLDVVAGTMGGFAQPQINAMNLIRAIDLGMTPADAVAAPRWSVEPDAPGAEPSAEAEAGVPAGVLEALQASGLRVDTLDSRDGIGHAHVIRVSEHGFEAGSDPRADGGAMAS